MPIGPDVLVFIAATKALLQSLRQQSLNEEERTELECCLRELCSQQTVNVTSHEGVHA